MRPRASCPPPSLPPPGCRSQGEELNSPSPEKERSDCWGRVGEGAKTALHSNLFAFTLPPSQPPPVSAVASQGEEQGSPSPESE